MTRAAPLVIALAAAILTCSPAAKAIPIVFTAELTGPNEDPPNSSPGTGFATVTIDPAAHTLHVEATFSDLIGPTTNAHIHCCTAVPLTGTIGVATTTPTFPGFPSGVTSGSYDQILMTNIASTYNPAFIGASGGTVDLAEAALFSGIIAGEAYFNIHSIVFPGGEIRGFLVPAAVPVPEPASIAILGSSLFALALLRARRRRRPDHRL